MKRKESSFSAIYNLDRLFGLGKISPITLFAIIVFFIALGDAIMSYNVPIYLEANTNSPTMMGIIMAFSSLAGVFFDLLISKVQWNKSYAFFIRIALFLCAFFPLTLILLPPVTSTFILAMIIWGAYYEYRAFSDYNFIEQFETKEFNTKSWAILAAFTSFAYILGPTIGAALDQSRQTQGFIIALGAFVVSIVLYRTFRSRFSGRIHVRHIEVKDAKLSFIAHSHILTKLWKKIWPLFIFSLTLTLIDSSIWTVGVLYSQKLGEISAIGTLFVTFYMLPDLFTGFLANKYKDFFGKKRTSFTAALLAAFVLTLMGATFSVNGSLILVFFMGGLLNMAFILHSAVIEDYVDRLHIFGNEMVTIQQVSSSIGYIIGPVVMGALVQIGGFHKTFTVSGIILGGVAIFCSMIVPRKIKMPYQSLQIEVENSQTSIE